MVKQNKNSRYDLRWFAIVLLFTSLFSLVASEVCPEPPKATRKIDARDAWFGPIAIFQVGELVPPEREATPLEKYGPTFFWLAYLVTAIAGLSCALASRSRGMKWLVLAYALVLVAAPVAVMALF